MRVSHVQYRELHNEKKEEEGGGQKKLLTSFV